jgi:Tetratricopeptide repeat/PEGA domain
MRILIALWIVGAVLCARTVALADDIVDEAREHYKQGVTLYEEGKYDQASIAFERAYELKPHHKILWNIGQVENELGHYAAALAAYERYLTEGGNEIPKKRDKQAGAEISRLNMLVGTIIIQSEVDGATVFVDGKRKGDTPISEPVFVNLGEHEVLLKSGGDELHREVVRVAGGKEITVSVSKKSHDVEPAKETETTLGAEEGTEEPSGKRVWTWVAMGIGGVSGIAGGIIGGVALSKKTDIDADCVDNHCPPGSKSDGDKVATMALTADVLYGVAAVGVIAGIVLFFVEPKLGQESKVAFAPIMSPDGAGVAISGRF